MGVKAIIMLNDIKTLVPVSHFEDTTLIVRLKNEALRISKKEVIKYIK